MEYSKLLNGETVMQISKSSGLDDVFQWITPELLQERIFNGTNIAYGVKVGDEWCGIIVLGKEEEGRLWIEALGVHEDHRRKGIARNLVKLAKDFADREDYRAIFVDVDDDNLIAQKFYQSVGFVRSGMVNSYYFDETDAFIYRFDL